MPQERMKIMKAGVAQLPPGHPLKPQFEEILAIADPKKRLLAAREWYEKMQPHKRGGAMRRFRGRRAIFGSDGMS
jgi:hypothetical protein